MTKDQFGAWLVEHGACEEQAAAALAWCPEEGLRGTLEEVQSAQAAGLPVERALERGFPVCSELLAVLSADPDPW